MLLLNELVGILSIKKNGHIIYQQNPVVTPKGELSDSSKDKPSDLQYNQEAEKS
jgi:hypothetical protein